MMNGKMAGDHQRQKMIKICNIFFIFFGLACCLFACAPSAPLDDYSHYLRNKNIAKPHLKRLPHCYHYGCASITTASISEQEWQKIVQLFKPASITAEEERKKIALTIQKFEHFIGAATGTKEDKKGTFKHFLDTQTDPLKYQQDCIDESTNTTLYMALLQNHGLLRFHRVTQPQSRQPLISGRGWWHQTATIQEIDSKKRYAVDSWFEDNGHPAHIIPLDLWKKGWEPKTPSPP